MSEKKGEDEEQWPRRPSSLNGRSKQGLPSLHDYEGASQALANIAPHLFAQDGKVEVMACRTQQNGDYSSRPLLSLSALKNYLDLTLPALSSAEKDIPTKPSTDIFLIDQHTSRSSLCISQTGLNLLLDHLGAHPELAKMLPAFAADDVPFYEGQSGLQESPPKPAEGDSVFEISLLIKYVEKSPRQADRAPWTIRQTLVYQRLKSCQHQHVILRASSALQDRIIKDILERSDSATYGFVNHWTMFSSLLVNTLPSNWSEYIKWLDLQVWNLSKSTDFSSPKQFVMGGAAYTELQAAQWLRDLVCRASSVLRNNVEVLTALASVANKRRAIEIQCAKEALSAGSMTSEHAAASQASYDLLEHAVSTAIRELKLFGGHLNLIQDRLDHISEAIRDLISIRSANFMAAESRDMHNLTKITIQDGRTVKTIAVLTLIYLPVSFTASFLAMGYVHVQESTRFSIVASRDMWLFLTIALPLVLMTLVGWRVWERRKANQESNSESDISPQNTQKYISPARNWTGLWSKNAPDQKLSTQANIEPRGFLAV